MKTIGDILKELRLNRNLLLREVAASIKIDSALLSKYEKGIRLPTKEQIKKFSKYFNINEKILLTLWLSDKIVNVLTEYDDISLNVLKVAEEKIKC